MFPEWNNQHQKVNATFCHFDKQFVDRHRFGLPKSQRGRHKSSLYKIKLIDVCDLYVSQKKIDMSPVCMRVK